MEQAVDTYKAQTSPDEFRHCEHFDHGEVLPISHKSHDFFNAHRSFEDAVRRFLDRWDDEEDRMMDSWLEEERRLRNWEEMKAEEQRRFREWEMLKMEEERERKLKELEERRGEERAEEKRKLKEWQKMKAEDNRHFLITGEEVNKKEEKIHNVMEDEGSLVNENKEKKLEGKINQQQQEEEEDEGYVSINHKAKGEVKRKLIAREPVGRSSVERDERWDDARGVTGMTDETGRKIFIDMNDFRHGDVEVKVVGDKELLVEGRSSLPFHTFRRHFTLPEGTNMTAITSAMSSDGVLTISAPNFVSVMRHNRSIPVLRPGQELDQTRTSPRPDPLMERPHRYADDSDLLRREPVSVPTIYEKYPELFQGVQQPYDPYASARQDQPSTNTCKPYSLDTNSYSMDTKPYSSGSNPYDSRKYKFYEEEEPESFKEFQKSERTCNCHKCYLKEVYKTKGHV